MGDIDKNVERKETSSSLALLHRILESSTVVAAAAGMVSLTTTLGFQNVIAIPVSALLGALIGVAAARERAATKR